MIKIHMQHSTQILNEPIARFGKKIKACKVNGNQTNAYLTSRLPSYLLWHRLPRRGWLPPP